MAGIPRHFRRLFLGVNTLLVLIASAALGALLLLHRDSVSPLEIVLVLAVVFALLPGVVYLLYRRFRDALAQAMAAADRASQEARTRQGEMAQILEALIDPILSIDAAGTIQTANRASADVFGWEPDELLGRNVKMLMAEPYRAEHDDYIERYLRTREAKAIGRVRKVLGRRRNGAEFPCELSVSEVHAPEGLRFVGVVRDISERENMSARLAQAERLAAIGELAAGIAHEINNPVNTIVNCAQLLKDGDDDPALVEDVMQEGMRIASIVRDLLDFARDHGEDHSPTRIQDVVERTLSLVSHRIRKQGITLEVDVDDGLPVIKGRSQQLQQVLLNLLLNARDALVADSRDREKKIRIEARERGVPPDRCLEIHVQDNGPGIAPRDRERIFQPFYTTKRNRGGTGLGLAVSLGIVKSHHGTLTVDSVPGEQTVFVVSLPVDNGWKEVGVGQDRPD